MRKNILLLCRKERLQESHQLQLFKANQRLLLDWTLKQSDEMAKNGLPKNKTEAESFILEHQNWKVFKKIADRFLFLSRNTKLKQIHLHFDPKQLKNEERHK